MPAANVIIANLKVKGSSTEIDGHFRITNVPEGRYELIVTYLGYQSLIKEVEIKSENIHLDFSLVPSSELLSPVVVTATRGERVLSEIPVRTEVISSKQSKKRAQPRFMIFLIKLQMSA